MRSKSCGKTETWIIHTMVFERWLTCEHNGSIYYQQNSLAATLIWSSTTFRPNKAHWVTSSLALVIRQSG